MQFLCFILLGLVSLAVASVKIVPGRAFDRLITIWLENQVRFTTHKSQLPLCNPEF